MAGNVTDLITLSGEAVQTATTTPRSFQGQPPISVAGVFSFGVAYQLDGSIHDNPYDGSSLPFPFPDALQEFKVETSALSALRPDTTVDGSITNSSNTFSNFEHEYVPADSFSKGSKYFPVRAEKPF